MRHHCRGATHIYLGCRPLGRPPPPHHTEGRKMGMATAPDNRMQLRRMEPADLPGAHLLSKAERWPHRLEDLQMMLSLGDGIVAEVAGEIIATTMWFPAGNSIATIG